MARKDCHIVLITVLLASARLAAGAPDWAADLRRELNDMTREINRDIQEQMHELEQDLKEQLADVNEEIENLPKDSQGFIISNEGSILVNDGRVTINGRTFVTDGNTMSVSNVNGITRIITSGRTPDGEPYVRKIEERSDEKYLYHNETSCNPKTNEITEKIRWRLDRTTPGATPENLADESKTKHSCSLFL